MCEGVIYETDKNVLMKDKRCAATVIGHGTLQLTALIPKGSNGLKEKIERMSGRELKNSEGEKEENRRFCTSAE